MKKLLAIIVLSLLLSNNALAEKKFAGWHFAEFQRCAMVHKDFESIFQCGVNNSDRNKSGYDDFMLYAKTLKEAVQEGGIGNSSAKLKLIEHCETVQSKFISMALFGIR